MKNNKILTQSSEINHEYCCTVVRIGKLLPIPGKDRIVQTFVNGMSMVVRKDIVNEGDIMIYAMNETVLNEKFLSSNNLFESSEYRRNSNASEVDAIRAKDPDADIRPYCGFFNKHGRVKLLRLGGIPSYGFLFTIDELAKVFPDAASVNYEELVDTDFDTVCGELFVKVYVPFVSERNNNTPGNKRNNRLRAFDRIIPGEFSFHYDTKQLAREIVRIKPTDVVDISVKCHGTSFICGNVLTVQPKWSGIYARVFDYLPSFLRFTKHDYSNVYSSRTVIKNRYINKGVGEGFYGTDVWGEYAQLLDGKLPKGYTVYGEIVGYIGGSQKFIQKDYDYGCAAGTNKLMIYRVTVKPEDGIVTELNISEVIDFTKCLVGAYGELRDRIMVFPLLYHGTLAELYPDIAVDNQWTDNVLMALRSDKKLLGMELNEPLCSNRVPREGIVLRIEDDPMAEAFKLKTDKFFQKESKEMDNYTGGDMEMDERY